MYLRDTLKHVLDVIIDETGSNGLAEDEPIVRACRRLYEEDPRSLSRPPGLTVRRKVENVPLRHFTAGEPWSQSRGQSIWSKIGTLIEEVSRESKAVYTETIIPKVIIRNWSVQPDWQATTSVGQLVRHVQWILDHPTILTPRTNALPDDGFQIMMDPLPGRDDTPDWPLQV